MRIYGKVEDMDGAELMLKRMEKTKDNLPRYRLYLRLLNQFASSATLEGAERGEFLVQRLKDFSVSRPEITPTTIAYNILLKGWALSGSPTAAQRSWDLLQRMDNDGIEPTIGTFRKAIEFFIDCRTVIATQYADHLLRSMENHRNPSLRPSSSDFTPVIYGWVEARNMQNAHSVLDRKIQAYRSDEKPEVIVSAVDLEIIYKAHKRNLDLYGMTSFVDKMLRMNLGVKHWPRPNTVQDLLYRWRSSDLPERDVQVARIEALIEKRRVSGIFVNYIPVHRNGKYTIHLPHGGRKYSMNKQDSL